MQNETQITVNGNTYLVRQGVAEDINGLIAPYKPIGAQSEAPVDPTEFVPADVDKVNMAYKNLEIIRDKLLKAKVTKKKISLSVEVKEFMTGSINQIMAFLLPSVKDDNPDKREIQHKIIKTKDGKLRIIDSQ